MRAGEQRASTERRVERLIPGFTPENELEERVTADPVLLAGLEWGRPRKAHPEGSVGAHVGEMLATLEDWGDAEPVRSELRFIAIVHDSLKYRVVSWLPRSGENHHAMRARRFAEGYTEDERLLATIELHDKPYATWRKGQRLLGRIDERELDRLVKRLPDTRLFLRFVELDASSEAKNPEPIRWFRDELARRAPD